MGGKDSEGFQREIETLSAGRQGVNIYPTQPELNDDK